MYGLVNQGIREFVTRNFGIKDWEDVCRRAGLTERDFEGMLTYPDNVTYDLVGAISDKYAMSSAEVLHVFGDFWVDFSKNTEIGALLRFGGETLIDRLDTLNEMHARVKMGMPHLSPPVFEFEEEAPGVYKLHYASEREGLEYMVIGLVEGLGRETGQPVTITQDPQPAYEGLRASFTLRLQQA
ncbi:MAG: heme NO-binding domain-containing protein [Pseudomonadota bacterium]